jgi:hypothetical protein
MSDWDAVNTLFHIKSGIQPQSFELQFHPEILLFLNLLSAISYDLKSTLFPLSFLLDSETSGKL